MEEESLICSQKLHLCNLLKEFQKTTSSCSSQQLHPKTEIQIHFDFNHTSLLFRLFKCLFSSLFVVTLDCLQKGLCLRICFEMFSNRFDQFIDNFSDCWLEVSWMQLSSLKVLSQLLIRLINSKYNILYLFPPFSADLPTYRLFLVPKTMFLQ